MAPSYRHTNKNSSTEHFLIEIRCKNPKIMVPESLVSTVDHKERGRLLADNAPKTHLFTCTHGSTALREMRSDGGGSAFGDLSEAPPCGANDLFCSRDLEETVSFRGIAPATERDM